MAEPVSFTSLVRIGKAQLDAFLHAEVVYCPNMTELLPEWKPEHFHREVYHWTPMQHFHDAIRALRDDYDLLVVGYDQAQELLYMRHEYNHDWYTRLERELSLWYALSRHMTHAHAPQYAFVALFPPWGYGLSEQKLILQFTSEGLKRVESDAVVAFKQLEESIYKLDWSYTSPFFKSLPDDVNLEQFRRNYLEHTPLLPEIVHSWKSAQ